MKKIILAYLFLLICVPTAYAADKPNVIIMLVDNLGWGELGVYGGGVLRGAETSKTNQIVRAFRCLMATSSLPTSGAIGKCISFS